MMYKQRKSQRRKISMPRYLVRDLNEWNSRDPKKNVSRHEKRKSLHWKIFRLR